ATIRRSVPRLKPLPASLLLLLLLEALRRLDAALVDLRHGFGDLAGGEITATARGQAAERVAFVEFRRVKRSRFRAPRLDLLDDGCQPRGLVGHRLCIAFD